MSHKILGGAYIPAGQSLKSMLHFHQIATAGNVSYFKYDTPEENEKIYNSKEPPSYVDKFKNINCPTVLWSTDNDGLVMPKDIDDLKPLLGNVIADNRIQDECFDHATFAFPRKASCMPVREMFYKNLTETLKKLD